MKTKKLLALGLSGILAAGCLAGCGNSEGSQGAGTPDASASETAGGANEQAPADGADTGSEDGTASDAGNSDAADGNGASGGDGAYNVTWEDQAEIKLVFMSAGAIPSGLAEVEDAINEITESKINTHVSLEMIEMGNYIQQVSLKMSSSEPVDILLTFPGGAANFSTMATQNQLMDITDLLPEYGQGIVDTVGDYLAATTIEGAVYGIPVYRDLSTNLYVNMRTDVLEDLGILEQFENMQSLKDLEPILEAVKSSEKWSYLACLAPATGNGSVLVNSGGFPGLDSFDNNITYDTLGSADVLAIDPTGADPEVKLMAALDEYKELYELTHDWYEKGYVYKDSATDKETAQNLIKADKLLGCLMAGEVSSIATTEATIGMPMSAVKLLSLPITTGSCTKFTWAVPNTSKYPEAAVTFLNMMYTDPEINNLLSWGIEGRDYVVEDNIAKYPEGVTEAPYHSADFITGNQFLVVPWEGSDLDIRQQSLDAMADSEISVYLGFTCDTTAVSNEVAAVTNVVAEYGPQINSGIAEPQVLDDYLNKLSDVNIQKIIDEYQNQLDAWVAANK